MEELQNLIAHLKNQGLTDAKIPVDVWCGIIEYFVNKPEPKQCTIADVGRSTLDLKTIAHLIASKANMPYCWEDILYRLREGLPMPFKLKDN